MTTPTFNDVAPGEAPAEWSVALHSTEGGSDKLYNVSIVAKSGLWEVNYSNGRRGGTLAYGTKTKAPVAYADARKIATKVLKEKTGGGYLVVGGRQLSAGDSFQAIRVTEKMDTRYRPQLLQPIDRDEVEALLGDPAWIMQIKYDGERRGVLVEGGAASGAARKGYAVGLGDRVAAAVATIGRDADLDGEQVGDVFYCWDVLRVDGLDLRNRKLADRIAILEALAVERAGVVSVVVSYRTPAEKRAAYDKAVADKSEGVVFKRADSTYVADSRADWKKFKFIESLTAIATPNADRRSVALDLVDAEGARVRVGNVTVPANHQIPSEGEVVEVEYRRANRGGSLQEPVYKGRRPDMEWSDCRESQRVYKDYEVDDETEAVSFGM
jgi:bifunctional non-homologous end joining protein LigD